MHARSPFSASLTEHGATAHRQRSAAPSREPSERDGAPQRPTGSNHPQGTCCAAQPPEPGSAKRSALLHALRVRVSRRRHAHAHRSASAATSPPDSTRLVAVTEHGSFPANAADGSLGAQRHRCQSAVHNLTTRAMRVGDSSLSAESRVTPRTCLAFGYCGAARTNPRTLPA